MFYVPGSDSEDEEENEEDATEADVRMISYN